MKIDVEEKKISLEEYQEKNANPQNIKLAKSFVAIFEVLIAIIIVTCLFFVVLKLFDIHQIAGYIGLVVAVVVFIVAYIIPVSKLNNTKSFMTNVKTSNARLAQKYNKELRAEIADKMIDITSKTAELGWYNKDNIGKLAIACHTKNDQEIKEILSHIYKTDVKKAADKMIRKSAVRVGLTTALSQSEMVDTLFIVIYELNLIKDIVFLYGYRPTETQMAKIYKSVIRNALIAYGVSNLTSGVGKSIGSGLISAMDKVSQSRSFVASTLGSLASGLAGTAIESSIQFGINAALTVIIGNQTKKYLIHEYKLQEMLDNVVLIEEDDETRLIEAVKEEVREKLIKKQKSDKPATETGS